MDTLELFLQNMILWMVKICECVRLAISILLNSAACFSKKNEFEQVGRICTIVLEVDPKNVKAMYRRAMAAMALGRRDLAYWDLCIAAEIDPENKEVTTKLQEIKHSLNNDNSKHHSRTDSPVGLGSSLAAPRRKPVQHSKQDESGVMKEMQRAITIMQSLNSMDKLHEKESQPSKEEVIKEEQTTKEKEKIEEMVKVEKATEVETRKMEDVPMMAVETDSNLHGSNSQNSTQAESTYRFCNQRRPDSILTISRKNYQMMKAGKTIQCWNSKLCSWISVRLVQDSKEVKRQEADSAMENEKDIIMLDGVQQCKMERQENHSHLDTFMKND